MNENHMHNALNILNIIVIKKYLSYNILQCTTKSVSLLKN